jgi:hypothetical protein
MSDRVFVQRDDLGRVVRIMIEDGNQMTTVEMSPDRAEAFFRDGLRKSLDLQSGQVTIEEAVDDQATIEEAATPAEHSPAAEALADRDERPDVDAGEGAIYNPNDPLEW